MSSEQAAAAVVAHAPTAGEYIQHHLVPMQFNFALEPVKQTKIVDFGIFNADSVFFSVVLGALACLFLWLAARKMTSGVPGRFQAMVERMNCSNDDFIRTTEPRHYESSKAIWKAMQKNGVIINLKQQQKLG